jgi:hypothetical protein
MTVGAAADSWEHRRPQARAEVVWPSWLVPAGAEAQWVALQLALGRVVPPCRVEPALWFARRTQREVADQAAAVEACSWCPVLVECRAYALAAGERDGVWGGLRPEERTGRRPR